MLDILVNELTLTVALPQGTQMSYLSTCLEHTL